MSINRVANALLSEKNPIERHYVDNDPSRQVGAQGLDMARSGCETLDRAPQSEYSANRRYGLTPPAPRGDTSEPGDSSGYETILY